MGSHSPLCERSHLWISLAADGEISELELAALRQHLGGCAACAAYATGVDAIVHGLRAAPLIDPPAVVFAPRVRRLPVRPLQVGAAAAAIVVAVGFGRLAGRLDSASSVGRLHQSSVASTQQPYSEQHLLDLIARRVDAVHGRRTPT